MPFSASSAPTPFEQELTATAAHLAAALPPAANQIIDAGIAAVEATGTARNGLQAGQQAPDFALPNATGTVVTLSELLHQGPVVLVFYRGNWCPYCNVQLRAYQQALPDFARFGATLVAVSPQTPDFTYLTANEKALTYPVLSDVGNVVAQRYGLAYRVGASVARTLWSVGIDLTAFNGAADGDELPLTAAFVVAPDGTIAWADVRANFKQRPDPAEVLAALAQLPAPGPRAGAFPKL